MVVADVQGRPEYLDQVRGAVAGTPLEIVVEVLAARKRRLYAVDWRVFHVTSVELRGGTMWVNVEARDGRG